MAVSSISSGDGTGFEAKVDSKGRLHTRAGCPSHTVYSTLYNVANAPAVTTIANARTGRCSLTIQSQGGALNVRFAAADPTATDFVIGAGATFTLPFSYDGEVRAMGAGAAVNVLVLEGVE